MLFITLAMPSQGGTQQRELFQVDGNGYRHQAAQVTEIGKQ